jgi:hypothetical protein
MQALYLLALLPIAATTADPNSYGLRPERSTGDAINQCFLVLARKSSAQWVLDGDIRGCFDNISHSWMLHHIPADKLPDTYARLTFGTRNPDETGIAALHDFSLGPSSTTPAFKSARFTAS